MTTEYRTKYFYTLINKKDNVAMTNQALQHQLIRLKKEFLFENDFNVKQLTISSGKELNSVGAW